MVTGEEGRRREVRGRLPRTDELRGRWGRGKEVVEHDERAETEAYPPREVRLVQPRDPCAIIRIRKRGYRDQLDAGGVRTRRKWEKGAGTEGEAEDGEVDLLPRRVGVGGADEGGAGAAARFGRWRRARAEPSGGDGEKVGGAVERRCAGVERHGVAAGGRGELDWWWSWPVASQPRATQTSPIGLPNKKLCRWALEA
jgi:hypothetical protein